MQPITINNKFVILVSGAHDQLTKAGLHSEVNIIMRIKTVMGTVDHCFPSVTTS